MVPPRGRSGRIVVTLEEGAAFELAADLVNRAGLRVGDLLTKDAQDHLIEEDAPHRAREKALRLLAMRERSRREVEVRLQMGGFGPQVVADTIAWLQGLDYLDDRRFAARYREEKLRHGWGERRIRAELLRKGVDRRLIEEELDARDDDSGSSAEGFQAVTSLARKRFGKQFTVDPEASTRRLAGFMARRGYDWEAITAVARVLTQEAGAGEGQAEAEGIADEHAGSGSGGTLVP